MKNPVHLTDHSDGEFSWRECGSGEVVLFLHPIVGTRFYWDVQLAELSDTWRCVAIDAPGYGDSRIPVDPLAVSVSEWLLSFLDGLGVERAHVVGLSLGGMFALHAASQSPDRFGRLVIADTSAAFGIDPVEWLADWLAPLGAGKNPAMVAGEAIDAIVAAPLPADARSALVGAFERVSNEAFETASRYIAQHDVRERLPTLTNPCLVVVGENDEETPEIYARELVALLPNSRLEVMADVGHLTSVEAPAEFSRLVRQFLTS